MKRKRIAARASALGIFAIVCFGFVILFLIPNLTTLTISESASGTENVLSLILFMTGLISSLLFFRKKKG